MSTRYGQLTYTSFDTAGAAGGWQIKQATTELTDDETHTLIAGVRTVFHPAQPLPDYPTAEQLHNGPRRLAYRRIDTDQAGYWHTVPAGTDATGRPGNVFAHTLLDRAAGQPADLRPIQRWRSAHWLCPYGPAAVREAALPDTAPGPGGVVTKASVLSFALDTTTWRLGALFGLLDAVAAAMDGGAPVALGVHSPESAAQWIGLISFLMSAGTAATLNFSTYDRADQLALPGRGDQHLSAVPLADLAALPADVVAIDETATLSLGEIGGQPHLTAGGQPIEPTAWSAMAQVVLLDAALARRALDDIDHHAAHVNDAGLHPAWPLAMVVAGHHEFADAHPEAHTVIAAHSPHDLEPDSPAARTLTDLMAATLGTSTADAWNAVQNTPDGAAGDLADHTYLRRALADETWLDQLGPIPLRDRRTHRPPAPDLHPAIDAALTRAHRRGPERLARLADLLVRAGVEHPQLPAALAEVHTQLGDPQSGARLRHRLGQRIGQPTRLAIAATALRGPAGATHLPDEVLSWLADGITAPAPHQLRAARTWDHTFARAALRGVHALRFGPADAHEACASLWWLRVCGSPQFEQLAAASVWDPADLLAAAGDTALPGASALPTLLGAPDSPALQQLATTIIDANTDDTAVACAAVRRIDADTWVQRGYIEAYQSAYTPLWDAAIQTITPARLHPDFAVRMLTLAVVATIASQPYPPACAELAANSALAAAAVEQVSALAAAAVIIPAAVLAAAALRTAEHTDPATARIDNLLTEAARQVAAAPGAAVDDLDALAALMAQMSHRSTGADLRRHRKTAAKLVGRRPEPQPTPTRTRGSI